MFIFQLGKKFSYRIGYSVWWQIVICRLYDAMEIIQTTSAPNSIAADLDLRRRTKQLDLLDKLQLQSTKKRKERRKLVLCVRHSFSMWQQMMGMNISSLFLRHWVQIICYRDISVIAQLAHYGHGLEPAHLPVPKIVEDQVRELLLNCHRPEDIPKLLRQCRGFEWQNNSLEIQRPSLIHSFVDITSTWIMFVELHRRRASLISIAMCLIISRSIRWCSRWLVAIKIRRFCFIDHRLTRRDSWLWFRLRLQFVFTNSENQQQVSDWIDAYRIAGIRCRSHRRRYNPWHNQISWHSLGYTINYWSGRRGTTRVVLPYLIGKRNRIDAGVSCAQKAIGRQVQFDSLCVTKNDLEDARISRRNFLCPIWQMHSGTHGANSSM